LRSRAVILLAFLLLESLNSQSITDSWRSHKTLLYTGAGIYKVFSLSESRQDETSYVVSGTLTNRLNSFVSLNTGIDIYKPEFSRKVVVSFDFIPSVGFEEDNLILSIGAGGALLIGQGGLGFDFMAGFKAGYFLSKKQAVSIEIKSPIHYDNSAMFLFTAGVMFVL